MQTELISCLGTDLTVVNAARVSFDKESDWEVNHSVRQELSSKDAALIRYLAKHNHFTPFTHCMVTLRETIPIFVARQRFKQGSSEKEIDINPTIQGIPPALVDVYQHALKTCKWTYENLLEKGVCPEQARMVLPQSMYTSYYVTGSLSAFARAYKLRIDKHAQKEIQELAEKWNGIIRDLFPVSWEALIDGK